MTTAVRHLCGLAAFLSLLVPLHPAPLRAQPGQNTRAREAREAQKRREEELLKSARESHSTAVLLMQAAAVVVGLMLFYGAFSTLTKGLKINKEKQLGGTGAKVIAAILLLAGIAVIALGILYAPTLGP